MPMPKLVRNKLFLRTFIDHEVTYNFAGFELILRSVQTATGAVAVERPADAK